MLSTVVGWVVTAVLNWLAGFLKGEVLKKKAKDKRDKKVDDLIKKLEESKGAKQQQDAISDIADDFGDL